MLRTIFPYKWDWPDEVIEIALGITFVHESLLFGDPP